MKSAVNFAWPVTSTNREDFEAFNEWFEYNIDDLNDGQLVIWGAGIRGTEFSIYLRKNGFLNVCFTDNNEQKWGGYIDDFPIIPPEEVHERIREKQAKILISTENSSSIEKQLQEMGYALNDDFFIIKSTLYEKYIHEFFRNYNKKILIIGDCEFSKISIKDQDYSNLAEMIKFQEGVDNTKILAMHGMGLRAYYHMIRIQLKMGWCPERLFVMVNFDTLTGKQHLLPRSQHAELVSEICRRLPNGDSELEEYAELTMERSKNIQAEFFTQTSTVLSGEKEREIKAKNYFRLNYMYRLDEEIEGIVYLKKIIRLTKEVGIEAIPFIPPVNYQLANRLLGDDFEKKYTRNLNLVKQIVEEEGTELFDLSFCLPSSMFAEPDTPDETANEYGRQKLAELFSKRIRA